MLILLAGMHFTIATHYCCGKLVLAKLSISGELASCGMEKGAVDKCLMPVKLSGTHCCKDKIAILAVDHSYLPSFLTFSSFPQPLLQVIVLPAFLTNHLQSPINFLSTNNSPPGSFLVSDVSLPIVCVFRI